MQTQLDKAIEETNKAFAKLEELLKSANAKDMRHIKEVLKKVN